MKQIYLVLTISRTVKTQREIEKLVKQLEKTGWDVDVTYDEESE